MTLGWLLPVIGGGATVVLAQATNPQHGLDWQQLAAIAGVVSAITGAANAWMRSSIKGQITQAKAEIVDHTEKKVEALRVDLARKDVTDAKIEAVRTSMAEKIESVREQLRGRIREVERRKDDQE